MTSVTDDTPGAVSSKKRSNDRRCVATGEPLAPEAPALRFVRDPSGHLVFDAKAKLPGRGAWLTASRGALLTGLKKNAFSRSFKASAALPGGMTAETYADDIEATLGDQALKALGLARKAGALAMGKDAAKESKSKAIAYLSPQDGSEGEIAKVASLLSKAADVPHIPLPASRAQLAQALGQDAVHVVLLRHPAAKKALAATALWTHFPTR
ncbi:MAG: DUF448 domain-containing protein [Pseudomonadota bacterium]